MSEILLDPSAPVWQQLQSLSSGELTSQPLALRTLLNLHLELSSLFFYIYDCDDYLVGSLTSRTVEILASC